MVDNNPTPQDGEGVRGELNVYKSNLNVQKCIYAVGDLISINIMSRLQISQPTAVDWYNFVRDVCAEYFQQHPMTIGGPGIEVEIDESKFGRREYNRGRWQEGHWVFRGVERITGRAFMVEVGQRDAATLIPIIQQYIRLVILEMM